jgi:hypothetical protein
MYKVSKVLFTFVVILITITIIILIFKCNKEAFTIPVRKNPLFPVNEKDITPYEKKYFYGQDFNVYLNSNDLTGSHDGLFRNNKFVILDADVYNNVR